jgi:hypothetical protein
MNAPAWPREFAPTPAVIDEMLAHLGVMQRAPSSWETSPRLASMPRNHVPFAAPPVTLPRGVRGPWPQPAVIDPDFYAPVLHVPFEDRMDHVRNIVSRYVRQLVTEAPGAVRRAIQGPRLVRVADDAFTDTLTATSFGQFVRLVTLAEVPASLAPHAGSPEGIACCDFSFAPTDELLPGVFAAPVVVLLRRACERWQALAIEVDGRAVTPAEGDTWELAKWYALQGAQLRLVTSAHPRLHFPADVIHAVTRSLLPKGHPVHRLVRPHTRFTLGLHEAVIHHRRSAIHNAQSEVYNGFPYTTEGMHRMVAAGHRGVAGRPDWPAWRFGDLFTGAHVPYGRFRRAWLDAWTGFAAEMLARVPRHDPKVIAWAEHIAGWLPGFPDGRAIVEDGALARAVAIYLATVSTFHTADHHSFAAIPLERMPMRLRLAMPAAGPVGPLDLDAIVSPEDAFRHTMGHAMFFRPAVITSLRDIAYPAADARERRTVARWEATMDALDARWAGSGFPRSSETASGVHY